MLAIRASGCPGLTPLAKSESAAELGSSAESACSILASPLASALSQARHEWRDQLLHADEDQEGRPQEAAAEDLAALLRREPASAPPRGWLAAHASVSATQRAALASWLAGAAAARGWGLSCAELAVSLLDRFLAHNHFGGGRNWAMQLGAVACLAIAAKVDGSPLPPSLDRLQGAPAPAPWVPFASSAVLRMERAVLVMLGWRATGPTPSCYMDALLAAGAAGAGGAVRRAVRSRASAILWSALADGAAMAHRPSEVAAGCLVLAARAAGADWLEAGMLCALGKAASMDSCLTALALHAAAPPRSAAWSAARLLPAPRPLKRARVAGPGSAPCMVPAAELAG